MECRSLSSSRYRSEFDGEKQPVLRNDAMCSLMSITVTMNYWIIAST